MEAEVEEARAFFTHIMTRIFTFSVFFASFPSNCEQKKQSQPANRSVVAAAVAAVMVEGLKYGPNTAPDLLAVIHNPYTHPHLAWARKCVVQWCVEVCKPTCKCQQNRPLQWFRFSQPQHEGRTADIDKRSV